MKVKIFYYGIYSKISGKNLETIDFNGHLVSELKQYLNNIYPGIIMDGTIISKNFKTISDNDEIYENDEIILMSPGPGG